MEFINHLNAIVIVYVEVRLKKKSFMKKKNIW